MLFRLLRWAFTLALFGVLAVALVLAGFRWQADRREVRDAADLAPQGGRLLQAADVAIFVQEAGPADGPAVLFIHGTGAWSETWRDSLAAAAKAGWRAIALDLPPFGFSQRPDDASYAPLQQGKRIVGVLDALKIPRVVLVGHSFGGGPTMEAALLAPERIRALVLVDAALGLGDGTPQGNESSAVVNAILGAPPLRDALVATFLTNPMFTRKLLESFIADPVHATDARVAIYRRPNSVTGTTLAIGQWLPELLAPAGATPSRDPASYRALKIPVLVVWGDRDTITPLPQGKYLASLVPGARLAVLEGAGHIPQIEDPARFNELLVAFLGKLGN